MDENSKPKDNNRKPYDLGERTFKFTKRIFAYLNELPKTLVNIEISRQLVNAGSSVGANYIEAEEALSKKDFVMRIKISRKEAKETIYWLRLSEFREVQKIEQQELIQEATELMKIFGSIIEKSK